MDGTLLNENSEVSMLFFEQFKALQKHNIHFVAASGRQYQSIRRALDTIKDDISIIAENGSLMQFNNKTEVLLELPIKDIHECIRVLRPIKNCYVVLCGKKRAYIETRNPYFITLFDEYYTAFDIVEDLTKVTNDTFLKIAVYHFESAEAYVLPHVSGLATHVKLTISGKNWLDISHKHANKGYALNMLQQKLGVSTKDTLVFGDYNNDLQMLELAHFSFAMKNAHPHVKKIANFETKSNTNQGVEHILQQLIASKEA